MNESNRFLQRSSEQQHYETWINSPNFEAELTEVLKGNQNYSFSNGRTIPPQPEQQPVTQEPSNDDNS